jgi:serine/threonine protein kinase
LELVSLAMLCSLMSIVIPLHFIYGAIPLNQSKEIHWRKKTHTLCPWLSLQILAHHYDKGTFGQVWLVSRKTSDGDERVYALKIQSKYELVKSGQAKAVVHEKNIVAQLRHPFINGLVGSFQVKLV